MNLSVIILGIFVGIWMLCIFLGLITGIGKSFSKKPASISLQAKQNDTDQHETAEEIKLKQKRAMEDLKQRIKDGAHK